MKKYSYVLGVVKIRYSSFSVSSCSDVSAIDLVSELSADHVSSKYLRD